MKQCTMCKKFLPLSEFSKRRIGNDGLNYRCRKCQSVYFKNKNLVMKKYIVEKLGGKCKRCGYSEFISGLEFHHVDKNTKIDKMSCLSNIIKSGDINKAVLEIDKCVLLCGCCHDSFEANEWDAEFVKIDIGWEIKNHWVVLDNE